MMAPSTLPQGSEMAMDEAAAGAPEQAAREAGGGQPLLASTAEAAESREIIYTGEMTVEVDDVLQSAKSIEELIETSKGFLGSRTSNTDAQGNTSTIISMRVPAATFDAVVEQLRTLGEVRSERINAEDVTKQALDLEARLKNLRREEGVIAELFRREGKIEAILQVERELARVRGEIEQGESSLRYLRENVRFSTITVTLNPKPTKVAQKIEEWSAAYHVQGAWKALVAIVRGLITVLIYTLIVGGPFVGMGLLIWWAIRARRRAPL
jgi:hypothetical protein